MVHFRRISGYIIVASGIESLMVTDSLGSTTDLRLASGVASSIVSTCLFLCNILNYLSTEEGM